MPIHADTSKRERGGGGDDGEGTGRGGEQESNGGGIQRDSPEVQLFQREGRREERTARVRKACWESRENPCQAPHTNKAARKIR